MSEWGNSYVNASSHEFPNTDRFLPQPLANFWYLDLISLLSLKLVQQAVEG